MSTTMLKESILTFKVNDIYEIEDIVEELVIRGYKKSAITTEIGTFSVRGSIIDIYPINEEEPIRLNFFDNFVKVISRCINSN